MIAKYPKRNQNLLSFTPRKNQENLLRKENQDNLFQIMNKSNQREVQLRKVKVKFLVQVSVKVKIEAMKKILQERKLKNYTCKLIT